jgi:hypothetical protein
MEVKKSKMDVVDLASVASIEQISRFNEKFIPEKRLAELEFLKWKYRTPNSDGENITSHFGLMDNDEVIAQIATQPMQMWLDESWQQVNYWGDWFRDPSYKGTGLVVLNHMIARGKSFLAASASQQAYDIYKRKKFELMPIDQRFIHVARPLASILASRHTPRIAARFAQRWFQKPLARIPKPLLEDGFQFAEAKNVDRDLLEGWESDAPPNTIFVRRESWMFSWFLDKFPFQEFKLVVLNQGGRQMGYVLLHIRKSDNGLIGGKIVDLFARGWNQGHLTALFREGARVLVKMGAHIVNYHATHPLFTSLAIGSGFTKTHDQTVIMYGPIAIAMASQKVNLHITYYDQDEAYY